MTPVFVDNLHVLSEISVRTISMCSKCGFNAYRLFPFMFSIGSYYPTGKKVANAYEIFYQHCLQVSAAIPQPSSGQNDTINNKFSS